MYVAFLVIYLYIFCNFWKCMVWYLTYNYKKNLIYKISEGQGIDVFHKLYFTNYQGK